MKIRDISLRLENGMAAYPRNPPFSMRQAASIPKASTNLSEISMGTHSGTHVDTEAHVKNGGKKAWPLEKLAGACAVLDCTRVPFGSGVESGHLEGKKIGRGEIILLKTKNSERGFAEFCPDFVFLSLSGAEFLAKAGAKAVGIDSIAIQKFHSGNQLVHSKLLLSGIPVIEGLDLKGVSEGKYGFYCLPLKMECDGLPARAILVGE